ncbi:MAG: TonB-dependent receptor [Parvibaculales bacterium]
MSKTLMVASLLPFILSPANAQETATDEVVVTARGTNDSGALKMPIPLINVPQSLSIIDTMEIKDRGFRELGDIVRYTPGINTSQGEGHRDSIVFRGVRSTADFYLDGVRDDVQYYRPLYNLERVEVLRGANAMQFGRGVSGAINRVTKKAMIGGSDSSVDVNLDTFGGYNLATDVNMPTGENSALRINAFIETLENDRDFYDGDRLGVTPTLRIATDDQTTVDLSLELMDHERFIDRGIPTGADGAPVDSLRDIVFGSPTENTTTLEATILRGSVTRKYSDTRTGVVSLTYGDYEKMYQNLYASGYSASNETVTLDGYRDPTERTNMILNGYVTDEFMAGGMRHTVLIGGEYVDTQSENLRYNSNWSTTGNDKETFDIANPLDLTTNASGTATTLNFNTDLNNRTETEITVTSLYIQDQIEVADNLQVLLGARMDNFDITVKDTEDLSNVTSESRKDEEISPRLGAIYKPQANLSFYASMSESFLPRSGEQFKSLSSSNAKLDPDVYENTEYGVKWDISDALHLAFAMFDSEQETAVSTGTGSSYIQGLTIDGYELEVKGRVGAKTDITFGYASLDGETKDGDTPRELPETMYSVFVAHQANERLNFGIGLTYQDESLIKDGSTAYLPDYTRIDASLSYMMSDATTLRVNIENLTDEEYYPHAHSTHQASVGDPMNAQVSLTRQF